MAYDPSWEINYITGEITALSMPQARLSCPILHEYNLAFLAELHYLQTNGTFWHAGGIGGFKLAQHLAAIQNLVIWANFSYNLGLELPT